MTWENEIICSDCLPIMREFPDKHFDLVVTDPPYGIKESSKKNATRGWRTMFGGKMAKAGSVVKPRDYGHYDWDKSPPSAEYFHEIFRVSKNQIIFGGNYFNLPPSPCWLVWDKLRSGDFADCELAWTSFPSAVRRFRYKWNGMLQQDMAHKEKRTHPTQKPVKLMEWCLEKYSKPGDRILDPFMGSGPVIEASIKLQRRFVGIDICQDYCNMAQARIDRVNNSRLSDFVGATA